MAQDLNSIPLSRRGAMQVMAAGAATLAINDAFAAAPAAQPMTSGHNPGAHWERWAKPQDAGFKNDLQGVIDTLYNKTTTSFSVIRGGKIAVSYGNLDQISYLASARKSVMSM